MSISANTCGALAFGLVVGWVTYRTLRRTQSSGISDIASVIGAVGGAAVTGLFGKETSGFGLYCIGLAIGFFLYLITALVLARTTKSPSVAEWLGNSPTTSGGNAALRGHDVIPPTAGG